RTLGQLGEDLVLGAVAYRLQLDLTAGGGHDRGEVGDARGDLTLPEPDGALERVGKEILVVADGHPHGDARALADLGGLAREVGQVGDDLLHVLWGAGGGASGGGTPALP